MANYIQYGDKKLPMGDMSLDDAKAVMQRHFPELANMKIETKKDGDDTVHIVSKQAGTKGNAPDVAASLLAVKPADFYATQPGRKVLRLIAGENVTLPEEQIEAIADDMRAEAHRIEHINARIERVPSAYPASEVVLL